jgi:putative SOS response-associated peptidase YedK
MCGRFTHFYTWAQVHAYLSYIGSVPPRELGIAYNVAPTQPVPVVRQVEGKYDLSLLRWGLVPFFARGKAGPYATFNARVESMETAATFRGPWKRGQRCIIPANGFYEWHGNADGTKQAFYITCADQPIFGFAGLWESSRAEDGQVLESATIITMDANPLMAEIHNSKSRMPAILERANHEAWLTGKPTEAQALLRQYPADLMLAWPVSSRVNSPRNQGPGLVARQ